MNDFSSNIYDKEKDKARYLKELEVFCNQHFVQTKYPYLVYHPPYTSWSNLR